SLLAILRRVPPVSAQTTVSWVSANRTDPSRVSENDVNPQQLPWSEHRRLSRASCIDALRLATQSERHSLAFGAIWTCCGQCERPMQRCNTWSRGNSK